MAESRKRQLVQITRFVIVPDLFAMLSRDERSLL